MFLQLFRQNCSEGTTVKRDEKDRPPFLQVVRWFERVRHFSVFLLFFFYGLHNLCRIYVLAGKQQRCWLKFLTTQNAVVKVLQRKIYSDRSRIKCDNKVLVMWSTNLSGAILLKKFNTSSRKKVKSRCGNLRGFRFAILQTMVILSFSIRMLHVLRFNVCHQALIRN